MRYPPATVNSKRNARLRSMCSDQVPWSMRVKRSWETLSNASAMAEQVVMLVKYSNAMRYIHSGSGIESHLPSESLCLFLCGLPPLRIFCSGIASSLIGRRRSGRGTSDTVDLNAWCELTPDGYTEGTPSR